MLHAFTREQLFHYTTKETAIEKIFPNMTIRMGSMRATNDPRETDPWFFSWVMEEGEPDPGHEFFAINRRIDETLKRSCLITCLTEDATDLRPEVDPDLYLREDLGPQGYEHDRMWAQYAGNHTGVCIFFNRTKLTQKIEEHFRGSPGRLLYGSVAYVPKFEFRRNSPFYELSWKEVRRMGAEAYARQHRDIFAQQLYLTKNPDWASEQEYRFVWIDDGEDEKEAIYVPIDGCVTTICLGARFPKVYEDNMRAIQERLGINLAKISYSYGSLSILPVD